MERAPRLASMFALIEQQTAREESSLVVWLLFGFAHVSHLGCVRRFLSKTQLGKKTVLGKAALCRGCWLDERVCVPFCAQPGSCLLTNSMDRGEDDDDDLLWVAQAVAMVVRARHQARALPPVTGQRIERLLPHRLQAVSFFEAIYNSSSIDLSRDHFRMDRDAFDSLHRACAPQIRLRTTYRELVIAVTLDWLGRAATVRDQETKFGMAFSTIHRYRMLGLHAIVKTLGSTIRLPQTSAPEFARTHLFFENTVAAIDGFHIPVVVARDDAERFRNRKGWTSTNVLLASDWRANVCGLFVGAEGSAHDSMVLSRSGLLDELPANKFVVADAGYALNTQTLTTFRGVRYHLKEWGVGSDRPRSAQELFNLRHAKARNIVEREIGILKRRFRVLRSPIECEFTVAKTIAIACACLHNFVRTHAPNDLGLDFVVAVGDRTTVRVSDVPDTQGAEFDFDSVKSWRLWIANAMWNEYENEPQRTI